jgi:hypothetical protein
MTPILFPSAEPTGTFGKISRGLGNLATLSYELSNAGIPMAKTLGLYATDIYKDKKAEEPADDLRRQNDANEALFAEQTRAVQQKFARLQFEAMELAKINEAGFKNSKGEAYTSYQEFLSANR